MREQQAERLATLLLGVAVTGATYYVLKTPALRRAAWQLVRTALAAAGPWLVSEARSAWAQSAREADSGAHAAPPGGGI
jgi:hypothetical protein